MTDASINPAAKGTLRSEEFDDVYFDEDDGLAETQHVFLEGNNFPDAWRGQEHFTIAETGFGTGLNFIAAWKLFDDTAHGSQKMHFISFENKPLDAMEIEAILQPWLDQLSPYLGILQQHYPPLIPGFHRLVLSEQVTLTLVFDDVNMALPELDAQVDAWFLDGFKPSTNPGMWSDTVFEHVERTSVPGTTFATFTAAGMVRRGLELMGFEVRKVPGFGTKRDMLVGQKA